MSPSLYKVTSAVLFAVTIGMTALTLFFYYDAEKSEQEAVEAITAAQAYEALATRHKNAYNAAMELHRTERGALVLRAVTAESQAKQLKEQRNALSDALRNDPSWADQPIPAGVLEALGGASDR